MKTFALLSAAALIGAGSLASSGAEARGGGGLAAGIIGGLAAGALIGAASQAHAGPAYGYDAPAYGYDGPAPVIYRPALAYRAYEIDAPAYPPRRILVEHREPYGYGPDRGWRHDRRDGPDFGRDRDCDRDDRGW